jgi:GNAT superfamily N-acetyltransferase
VDITSGLRLRHTQPGDYGRVLEVMDDWWGGLPRSARLSHAFFSHFGPTSFVIETETELVGFLLGFLSRTRDDEAYIHFVGVHPDFRRLGLGRRLYERYFAAARMHGRAWVRSITAPGNQVSIDFHRSMGFVSESGDGIVEGVPARLDHAGTGGHRVVFQRRIAPDVWPAAQEPHLVSPAAGEALLEVLELTDCA